MLPHETDVHFDSDFLMHYWFDESMQESSVVDRDRLLLHCFVSVTNICCCCLFACRCSTYQKENVEIIVSLVKINTMSCWDKKKSFGTWIVH